LQDKDFTIGESAAIIAYLAGRYGRSGSNSLVPEGPMLFARWLEWCFFILTELDSSLYVMRRHGTAKGLAHLYGHAPDVVRRAGEYFREQLPTKMQSG
jgi:glutathione S-transferase